MVAVMTTLDRFGTNWSGRTVTVIGLGKSGVAACRLLVSLGCRVRVTDAHDTDSLRQTSQQLKRDGVESVELGHHTRHIVEGAEVLIASPGVPESAAPMQWAIEAGISILSEIELAFRFCPSQIVAVTGTNGKSSAVTLIERLLRAAGRRAIACGNLGIPFCSVIDQLTPATVVVLEVSSFQLLWCERFRPSIGVLLNLGINHLDRHADQEAYTAAKARLFACQTFKDYAVLNARDPAVVALGQEVCAQRVWFGAPAENPPGLELDPLTQRALPENLQAILQVSRLLRIPDPLAYQIIREFRGLEHRLEDAGTIRSVRFVNDSKSTTPESLIYALSRCAGPIVTIVGGKDKGLNFEQLKAVLAQARIRGVVLIGESRQKLKALMNGSGATRECATLDEAVRDALALARPGDTVLFSPACASFDMFRNFEDRGAQFKRVVRTLAQAS